MSKVISDEEILDILAELAVKRHPEISYGVARIMAEGTDYKRAIAKAQRDSSDKEWIKKLKKLPSVFDSDDVLLDVMEYKKKLDKFFEELE